MTYLPADAMSMIEGMIELIKEELEAYRATGRTVHLAHAARAFDDIRKELASAPIDRNVDASDHRR